MHRLTRSVFILCLLISCWFREGKSENVKVSEVRQENSPQESVHKTSENEARVERTSKPSSYSGGSALSRTSSYSSRNDAQSAGIEAGIGENCHDDIVCLSMASNDRIGLEAIRALHRQLDDDANGNVDLSESDEFLREELKYEQGYERRQRAFHFNDDMHISVRELWEAWIRSEVHNWTVEQASEWLATNVELPQYISTFILHRVTGATLPRLAVNNMHYLHNVLGIKDPIHKQKIALKAMDVVLFGPPKDYNNHIKDLVLVTLLLGALIGCWYAYRQNKNSRKHLRRMMKDMESLQKAELALDHLQKELERARLEQENVATEKENLQRQLLEQGSDQNLEMRTSYSDLEVSQLKAEIEMLRGELQKAEGELEDRCWSPPHGLQHWLQITHELENKGYIKKKIAAEKQLQQAREACEKLRKKRSSLVGAFVSTHGKSIDDVDRSIVEARTLLNEVTQELQERVVRWKQLELLCGFNIINNNGLQYLENMLNRGGSNPRKGRMSSSQDDLDDDSSSIYTSAGAEGALWKEGADSSGSETGKPDLEEDVQNHPTEHRNSSGNVKFTVGGDSWAEDGRGSNARGSQRVSMIRCVSQDTGMMLGARDPSLSKSSLSETHLVEQGVPRATSSGSGRKHSSREHTHQFQHQATVEEEQYSTDSNSTTDDDVRRRKRKLFSGFPRKPKAS